MRINVAYACDDNYISQTGISIISLLENNKNIDQIYVYFIDMGVSVQSIEKIKKIITNYGRNLVVIPFDEWKKDLEINNIGRHIESVYAKIFFGRLNGIDKILYLDSDTVIVDKLDQLWNIDMKDFWVAGVDTIYSMKNNVKFDEYFINDGIVLINLEAWRKHDLEKKCLDYIKQYDGNPPVLSEGTINYVCDGHIYLLNPRYNLLSGIIYFSNYEIEAMIGRKYYGQDTLDKSIENPCIIHYLSAFYNRPWNKYCTHPKKDEYFKYKAMSDWKNEPFGNVKLSLRLQFIDLLHKLLPKSLFVKLYLYFN